MDKPFTTTDQGLATYLVVKGYTLVRAIPANDPKDPRRNQFVFIGVDNSEQIEKDYDNFVPDLISPKEFAKRWRVVTKIAKNALTNEDIERLRRG